MKDRSQEVGTNFSKWEGNQMLKEGEGKRGGKKRIQVCSAHVPSPQEECNQYVLQTYTNNK